MDSFSGAGNGTRTRDINLGKVALYQLSYSRIYCDQVFKYTTQSDLMQQVFLKIFYFLAP